MSVEAHSLNEVTLEYVARCTNQFNGDRLLGAGAFGDVHLGVDASTGMQFAVKRLNDATSAEREVAVLTRFSSHPHVIRLLGYTPRGQSPRCLAYELASRGSLEAVLRDDAASCEFSWKARVRVAAGVACALNYLHRSQDTPVFHRDVKAANVCLMADYTPKLIDCGVSMLIDEQRLQGRPGQAPATSLTVTGNRAIGTDAYMCPKYARLPRFGEKTEVFSFGLVLLELLTGRVNHDDDMLYEAFIDPDNDDREDLRACWDRRAGDWLAPVGAELGDLGTRAAGSKPSSRPTMLAVLRTLKVMEVAHCARSAEEMALMAELERVREELERLRVERDAVPSAQTCVCAVCYDEEMPAGDGILCGSGHFTCDGCLERHVLGKAEELTSLNELHARFVTAEAQDNVTLALELSGRVFCLLRRADAHSGCDAAALGDGAIARHVSEAAFAAHCHAKTLLPVARESARVFNEAQAALRAEVERVQAQLREGRAIEEGRALLAAQLRQSMPNARQCGQCGFGPVEHVACGDLQTHQGQQAGNARIDNRCPSCGWFSRDIREWPQWNGQLPAAIDQELGGAAAQTHSTGRTASGARWRLQRRRRRVHSRWPTKRSRLTSLKGGLTLLVDSARMLSTHPNAAGLKEAITPMGGHCRTATRQCGLRAIVMVAAEGLMRPSHLSGAAVKKGAHARRAHARTVAALTQGARHALTQARRNSHKVSIATPAIVALVMGTTRRCTS